MSDRKPRMTFTVSPELKAYLSQPHINASGLVEACIRGEAEVPTGHIEKAAAEAGVGRFAEDSDSEADDE